MPKQDWGTKRLCPSCGARFFDLRRNPIECPKCEKVFEPKVSRPSRDAAEKLPEPAVAKTKASDEILEQADAKDDDDDDDDDDADLAADIDIDVDVDDDDDDDLEDKGVLEDASDLMGEDDGVPNIREQASEGTPDDR